MSRICRPLHSLAFTASHAPPPMAPPNKTFSAADGAAYARKGGIKNSFDAVVVKPSKPTPKRGQPKNKQRTKATETCVLATTTTTMLDKADATAKSKQSREDIDVPDGEEKPAAKKSRVSGSDKELPEDEVRPAPPPKATRINWGVGGNRREMVKAVSYWLNETPEGY